MKGMGSWVLIGIAVVGLGLGAAWGFGVFGGQKAPTASGVASATLPARASAPAPVVESSDGTLPHETSQQPAAESAAVVATQPAPAAETSNEIVDVAIGDLIKHGTDYLGRTLRVRGTIISQCIAGCEFGIADDSGTLSVQLVGAALDRILPGGSVGREVEAVGFIESTDRPQLLVDDPENWRLF